MATFLTYVVLVVAFGNYASACTNLLCTKGASTDGSNIISYNADASNFYTTIYHYPASINANGTMRKTYTWDYGTYLGEIPEAPVTYNVVGNINEYGLIITESTFGGLAELTCSQRTGLMDYGSLIWVTLQRSRTAREAILMMGQLVQDHGYASTGESFSIADQDELWYLELIGKGRHEKGAVWVARKVPDGYVTGHANQARITTFPQDDPASCLYSNDVVTFAKKIGLYPSDFPDADFSFSDVYDPVTFSGARFCEARVWSFFSAVMGEEWSNQYLSYAQGYDLTNRMPLWVKPPTKMSAQDIMQRMRSHYEGTPLSNTGLDFPDVGAGAFYDPNRNSPITWTSAAHPDKTFFNERTIAQGPTGWSIVCESRPAVPRQMAALLWFGMDDSSTSVHFPVYGSNTRVSAGWAGPGPQDGATPPIMTFSTESAFYVFNLVANWAYTRWESIYPDVLSAILEKEALYLDMVVTADKEALAMFEAGNDRAGVEYLTVFSVDIGDKLLKDWFTFFGQLFVKYRDGYITTAAPATPVCGCETDSLKYPDQWYDRIATDTGDRYIVPATGSEDDDIGNDVGSSSGRGNSGEVYRPHGRPVIDKKDLRAFN
jgi:dipeptidase